MRTGAREQSMECLHTRMASACCGCSGAAIPHAFTLCGRVKSTFEETSCGCVGQRMTAQPRGVEREGWRHGPGRGVQQIRALRRREKEGLEVLRPPENAPQTDFPSAEQAEGQGPISSRQSAKR